MKDVVVFSYRPDHLPEGGNMSGRQEIFDKLAALELRPLVSLEAEGAYTEETVAVHPLVGETSVADQIRIELGRVGTIVNRLDRTLFRGDSQRQQQLPATINEGTTRSLAFRKHRANDEVLAPLGINIPTQLVRSEAELDTFITQTPTERYVVKPDNGSNGKGVQVVDYAAVRTLFKESPDLYEKQIVQPAYDFTQPFPKSIKPYDALSTEAFEGWNTRQQTRELRVYGFHSPVATGVFPVGRAITDKDDQWFFVDPDSVPEELLERTAAAMQLTAKVSGAAAVLGTVDYGYGNQDNEAPTWRAIELNAKAPYIIGYDKHWHVADTLRTMLATQISQTVAAANRLERVH